MDVRDYFAGKALAGLMQEDQNFSKGKNIRKLAATAYQIADAMLEARECPSQPVLVVDEPRQEDVEKTPARDVKASKKNGKGKASSEGKSKLGT